MFQWKNIIWLYLNSDLTRAKCVLNWIHSCNQYLTFESAVGVVIVLHLYIHIPSRVSILLRCPFAINAQPDLICIFCLLRFLAHYSILVNLGAGYTIGGNIVKSCNHDSFEIIALCIISYDYYKYKYKYDSGVWCKLGVTIDMKRIRYVINLTLIRREELLTARIS